MKNFNTTLYSIGATLLVVAIAACVVLSGTKLGFFSSIPGCGAGSGCDAVTNGPWGKIPGIALPVSFIGLAWFLALLSVFHCCIANTCTSKGFLWCVRLGVLGSVGFIIVMISIGSFCKWCALAHLCNILFWTLCEFCVPKDCDQQGATENKTSSWGWWLSNKHIAIAFLVRFIVLLVFVWNAGRVVTAQRLEDEAVKSAENVEDVVKGSADQTTLQFLEGGHRIGSPSAPIQVVMFTDYQCPDCKRIEGQLANIMKTRDDVSVVVKHFPLNYDCNDQIGTFKLHGNACWAARAAEAAAIVGGEEAWETMHTWLFSQEGRFTDQTFAGSLTELGFNPQEIISVMMGDETLEAVKESARDGKALGVYFTPMVFINGVEYLWYYGGGVPLQSVIDSVATAIKNGDGAITPPPTASYKLVEDWRRGRRQKVPGTADLSWLGDGAIEFVVWGDYQADLSKDLDREIKAIINSGNANIKYTFRHYPVDESCNAGVSKMPVKYDGSCALAKLVIACDVLGGDGARWSMHDWILQQQSPISIEEANAYAASIAGVDQGLLGDVLLSIDVNDQMRADIFAKNRVWRKSIPVLTIDDRYVPRWRSDDVSASVLFQRILSVLEDDSAGLSAGTSK
ncbi:MAG: thioredoxin domain-containing protein [Planctomycetes bacterium]|nr:thioredoxin domain-containing protein [Planctomycetota bacterium]